MLFRHILDLLSRISPGMDLGYNLFMKKFFIPLVFLLVACGAPAEEFVADNYVPSDIEKVQEGDYEGYYINERFGFRFVPLENYDVVSMPSGEGAVMRRTISGVDYLREDKEDNTYPYNVEIKVMASENLLGFDDLAEFIQMRYDGFTIEGYESGEVSGFFVDEGIAGDAVRHFFTMKGEVIYEASLKLPSFYFDYHKEEFEAFVPTILFF